MSSRDDTSGGLGDVDVPRIVGRGDAGADALAGALLESSGAADALDALRSPIGIFQGAGARLLGARGDPAVVDDLAAVATDTTREETVQAEAAYALARLGDDRGVPELRRVLGLPLEASPGPLQAAGMLARLDDATGVDVVRRGLASPNPVTAIVAAKQLGDVAALPDAVDLDALLQMALQHSDERVGNEARRQLER